MEYNSVVEDAVMLFQKSEGLVQDGKYGIKSHAALMSAIENYKEEYNVDKKDVAHEHSKYVIIVSDGGNVNIRVGNGTEYKCIIAVAAGTRLGYIGAADNGWTAVKINDQVGWVSSKYSEVRN